MTREELIIKAEVDFKTLCINNKIKYKSKDYYDTQYAYFQGACSVIEGDPPIKWFISLETRREIIEPYKL